MKTNVKIKKLENFYNIDLPKFATDQSAGQDIMASLKENIVICPNQVKLIPTGFAIALPEGFEAQIRPRSGLALKHYITVLNSPGTIDADYRGEIKVMLINYGKDDFIVENGMRIAQMVISKYEKISWELSDFSEEETARGTGGFGSTGTNKL